MSRSLAVIPLMMVLASAACAIDSPTAPYAEEASLAAPTGFSASQSASAGQSLDFSSDLRHATEAASGFADAAVADRFREHLGNLSTSLNAGDKAEASRILGLARQELSPAAITHGDLGYIEMVFRNIDEAVAQ